MKKNYLHFIIGLLFCLTAQAQVPVQRELNPIEEEKLRLELFTSSRSLLRADTDGEVDYTKGVFILNEDWFGHNNSTINFLKSGDNSFVYRAFQKENPGKKLGCTSQYGTIYGDNLFIMSKQPKDPGDTFTSGRLVVADAKTMKVKLILENIGGGDGRAFVGVNEKTGYVGSSSGIYLFDIENLKLGDRIEGIEGSGDLYNGQIGMMIRTKTYVFAIQQSKGVLIIDPKTHQIIKLISGSFSTMTQSKDGNIWVGANTKLLCINPENLEESYLTLPNGLKIPDSWYAWTAGLLCASTQENALYFTTGGGFSSSPYIYRYEIGNLSSLDAPLYSIPEKGRNIYAGAGFRVSPDDIMYISVFENFGSVNYWQYAIDARTGAELGKYEMENAYWFPAMHIFPDVAAPVVSDFQAIKVSTNDDPVVVSLKGMATDNDNLSEAVYKSVKSVSDPELLTASIFGDDLTLTFLPDKHGEATVTVTFDSNGKIVEKELSVAVLKKELYLDKHSLSMSVGDSEQLTATSTGEVTWSSSDTEVATVDNQGLVEAVGNGKTQIIVKAGELADTCSVTVITPLSEIKFEKEEVILQRDSVSELKVLISPEGAVPSGLTWTSSDPTIVHVSKSGKITGMKDGAANVTVSANDTGLSATCKVTVRADMVSITLPETLVLDTNASGKQNSYTLKPVFVPASPTNSKVSWISSDPETVSVTSGGKVTALKAGKATITVTTEEGSFTAACEVNCTAWYESITLNQSLISMSLEEQQQLVATVSPEGVTTPLLFKSDNPDIASVDEDGMVTAKSYGKATITVQPEDGSSVTAQCVIAVEIPVTSITFNYETVQQDAGTVAQLIATIHPENATFRELTWKSSSMSPVRVSDDGKVSFVRKGQSNVTATSEFGGITATCVVIVNEISVETFELNKTELTIDIDKEDINTELQATITPENASDKTVKWSSSNEKILTIDQNGAITPLSAGEAIVYATSVACQKVASCKVKVTSAVTGISLNKTSANLLIGKSEQLTAVVTPDDAPNKNVNWLSSNPAVATVDQTGKVLAIAKGSSLISATTEMGKLTATCQITVSVPSDPDPIVAVDGITMSESKVSLVKGNSRILSVTITPQNATNKNVHWSSSDNMVASVDNEGKVTALYPGVSVITATSEDGNYKTTCTVTVIEPGDAELEAIDESSFILVFPKVEGATSYVVSLYKGVNNRYEFVENYVLDQNGATSDGNKSGLRAEEGKISYKLENLQASTSYLVRVEAMKRMGDENNLLAAFEVESKTTAVSNDAAKATKKNVFYSDNILRFENLEGFTCYIFTSTGRIVNLFEVTEYNTSHSVYLPAGVYILTAINENEKISFKFVVK